jgi:hypothetical protein
MCTKKNPDRILILFSVKWAVKLQAWLSFWKAASKIFTAHERADLTIR